MKLFRTRGHGARRIRLVLATTAVGVTTLAAPLVAPTPAGAVNAPLTTTDGIGIRVDETAILGPALEAIETALQPLVDDMVQDGAVAASVMDDPDYVYSESNLELSFDILAAGTTGYTDGGIKVHADVKDIFIEYYRYGSWWQPECWIWVEPDDATIDASAKINRSLLPNAPLQLNPITATWDDSPSISVSQWLCNGYLLDEYWDAFENFFSGDDPNSTASRIEAQLNGVAQDLVNQLWNDNVKPVLDSLTSFGITINQLRADAYGLIVTANVNASAGLTIPGQPGGPYSVTNTQDAGVTSNVNTLLANREEIIVSIHPNVVNQYLNALHQFLFGNYGFSTVGASIESVLLNPADRALYPDGDWGLDINVSTVPYIQPTGTGGAPEVSSPAVSFTFYNGFDVVAQFDGSFADMLLATEVRPGDDSWGPAFKTSAMTVNLTRTYADAKASLVAPQSNAAILPYVKGGFDTFSDTFFVPYVSLAPIEIYDMSISLCSACARFSGDQRYTERFRVA